MNIIKYLTDKDYRSNETELRKIEAAKKEADRLHEATGYKYYVIAWGKDYKAVNMPFINKMKKAKLLPKNYDWVRLERFSIYITA